MPLYIKNALAHALAKKLAATTGQTMTEVVIQSLEEKLARIKRKRDRVGLAEELNRLALRCSKLPVLDAREPDEILGYDEHGLPR